MQPHVVGRRAVIVVKQAAAVIGEVGQTEAVFVEIDHRAVIGFFKLRCAFGKGFGAALEDGGENVAPLRPAQLVKIRSAGQGDQFVVGQTVQRIFGRREFLEHSLQVADGACHQRIVEIGSAERFEDNFKIARAGIAIALHAVNAEAAFIQGFRHFAQCVTIVADKLIDVLTVGGFPAAECPDRAQIELLADEIIDLFAGDPVIEPSFVVGESLDYGCFSWVFVPVVEIGNRDKLAAARSV